MQQNRHSTGDYIHTRINSEPILRSEFLFALTEVKGIVCPLCTGKKKQQLLLLFLSLIIPGRFSGASVPA